MKSTSKWIFLALLQLCLVSGLLSGCSSMGAALEASPSLANAMGVADIPMSDLKKWYVSDNDHFIKVNGYDIHYRDVGQGPPVVLLHGIFSSLQTWDGWIGDLSKTHRVIALDMPGYGLTGAPKDIDNFSEQNIVNTFAKFVDRLQLEHFSLVGNSLGGYVAATYAADYPDRVDRLILLDPFGYPQSLPWIMSVATFAPVEFLGEYCLPPVIITLNVRWVYGDPRRITDDNIYRYVRMSQREGAKKIYVRTLDMIKKQAETEKPLPFYRIKAPTLLMWGGKDDWVPEKISKKWLDDIANSRLIVYPGVGHIPMEEVPQTTLKDAEPFLAGGFAALDKSKEKPKASDDSSAMPEMAPFDTKQIEQNGGNPSAAPKLTPTQ